MAVSDSAADLRSRFQALSSQIFGPEELGGVEDLENKLSNNDNGGMSDLPSRVAVLEQIAKDTRDLLKEMRDDNKAARERSDRDFRFLFGSLIAATLGLATLMAHGFKWI